MPSGGARLRSGPAPDPSALRRDRDGKDWVALPHERTGEIPEWPAEIPQPTLAEEALWRRYWRKPQALVWEADGVHDTVALYVRNFLEVAGGDASVARLTIVRQMADGLLLSIPALHAARYTIKPAPSEAAAAPAASPARAKAPATRGARALLTVVEHSDDDGDA